MNDAPDRGQELRALVDRADSRLYEHALAGRDLEAPLVEDLLCAPRLAVRDRPVVHLACAHCRANDHGDHGKREPAERSLPPMRRTPTPRTAREIPTTRQRCLPTRRFLTASSCRSPLTSAGTPRPTSANSLSAGLTLRITPRRVRPDPVDFSAVAACEWPNKRSCGGAVRRSSLASRRSGSAVFVAVSGSVVGRRRVGALPDGRPSEMPHSGSDCRGSNDVSTETMLEVRRPAGQEEAPRARYACPAHRACRRREGVQNGQGRLSRSARGRPLD